MVIITAERIYKDNSFYVACEDFTFGEQCSKQCTCDQQHTDQCNSVSGMCICKMGWEGIDCSKDIDECKEGSMTCDTEIQTCVNTPGSAHCECRYGGVDLNRCISKKKILPYVLVIQDTCKYWLDLI